MLAAGTVRVMDLGLTLGYWGRSMPQDMVTLAVEAEKAGFDAVWTAESWGSDAFSPLVLIAAHTERIRLGTGVVQISARTPAATAMQAVTLDHISNGRTILGLGVSGPQVVEGWYGMPSSHSPEPASTSRSCARPSAERARSSSRATIISCPTPAKERKASESRSRS